MNILINKVAAFLSIQNPLKKQIGEPWKLKKAHSYNMRLLKNCNYLSYASTKKPSWTIYRSTRLFYFDETFVLLLLHEL
ncbi:hypothetical protein HLI_03540 [Halobacillus litoralis]|uniref:Uncharacterized protein n=1 Tax=Halobacillus litoralis TaxID=45668 RepID=A0A410M9E1_9BACI|nr:hypothetical protein HLI_03540 [Halobacillus litoralis]